MHLLISLLLFLHLPQNKWNNNYIQAFEKAKTEHKLVLLNFSGSDWCGPCIKLHKDVFTLDAFNTIADDHLILVNADFPRAKKNQLLPAQQKLNEQLAEKYNSRGIFPLTLLVNDQGEILKTWEGYPNDINGFIEDLKESIRTSVN